MALIRNDNGSGVVSAFELMQQGCILYPALMIMYDARAHTVPSPHDHL